MRIKDSFHLYAIITIIFWSFAYVLTRLLLQFFSPYSLGFLRYFIASCTLLIIAFVTKMEPPKRIDFNWFIASGWFGFFLYMIAFNKGCETVTASTSSMIIATVPIMTALLSSLIYKEQLKGIQWLAIVIEFAGILMLTLMNGIFTFNIGSIWLLLAALSLSVYNLLQRQLIKRYTAFQTSTLSIFAGTVMLAIFAPLSFQELQHIPTIQLLNIAILGIFSSAIAFVSWAKAFEKANYAADVSNYMFAIPILTTLLGMALINERPDLPTIVSGIIILLGLLIFNRGGRAKQNEEEQKLLE